MFATLDMWEYIIAALSDITMKKDDEYSVLALYLEGEVEKTENKSQRFAIDINPQDYVLIIDALQAAGEDL